MVVINKLFKYCLVFITRLFVLIIKYTYMYICYLPNNSKGDVDQHEIIS